jgi:hypothetical protein
MRHPYIGVRVGPKISEMAFAMTVALDQSTTFVCWGLTATIAAHGCAQTHAWMVHQTTGELVARSTSRTAGAMTVVRELSTRSVSWVLTATTAACDRAAGRRRSRRRHHRCRRTHQMSMVARVFLTIHRAHTSHLEAPTIGVRASTA